MMDRNLTRTIKEIDYIRLHQEIESLKRQVVNKDREIEQMKERYAGLEQQVYLLERTR